MSPERCGPCLRDSVRGGTLRFNVPLSSLYLRRSDSLLRTRFSLQLIQSPVTTPLGLIMLKTTSEELACPREDLSVARKEELRKLLLDQVQAVLGLLTGEPCGAGAPRSRAVVLAVTVMELRNIECGTYCLWCSGGCGVPHAITPPNVSCDLLPLLSVCIGPPWNVD